MANLVSNIGTLLVRNSLVFGGRRRAHIVDFIRVFGRRSIPDPLSSSQGSSHSTRTRVNGSKSLAKHPIPQPNSRRTKHPPPVLMLLLQEGPLVKEERKKEHRLKLTLRPYATL